ncbi:MAG: T9SS type A sorting domain-containing protein [Chitinophagales bacterium]
MKNTLTLKCIVTPLIMLFFVMNLAAQDVTLDSVVTVGIVYPLDGKHIYSYDLNKKLVRSTHTDRINYTVLTYPYPPNSIFLHTISEYNSLGHETKITNFFLDTLTFDTISALDWESSYHSSGKWMNYKIYNYDFNISNNGIVAYSGTRTFNASNQVTSLSSISLYSTTFQNSQHNYSYNSSGLIDSIDYTNNYDPTKEFTLKYDYNSNSQLTAIKKNRKDSIINANPIYFNLRQDLSYLANGEIDSILTYRIYPNQAPILNSATQITYSIDGYCESGAYNNRYYEYSLNGTIDRFHQYSFNGNGQLTEYNEYLYNSPIPSNQLHKIIAQYNPDGKISSYYHDDFSFGERRKEYTYDSLSNLITFKYYELDYASVPRTVLEFEYDSLGNTRTIKVSTLNFSTMQLVEQESFLFHYYNELPIDEVVAMDYKYSFIQTYTSGGYFGSNIHNFSKVDSSIWNANNLIYYKQDDYYPGPFTEKLQRKYWEPKLDFQYENLEEYFIPHNHAFKSVERIITQTGDTFPLVKFYYSDTTANTNTGVNSITSNLIDLEIYPNPNKGSFNLKIGAWSNQGPKYYIIFNILGVQVAEGFVSEENQIHLDLQDGLYFLKLKDSEQETALKKFIIQE